jgi:AcrR family transcriptional regulator
MSTSKIHAPDTHRQRRRNQRRDRVYAAAVSLFIEQGYDGTTMDEIAEHAEVARSSVFNYFERKSAFLDDWAARRRERAFDSATDPDAPLHDRLTQLMSVLADISIESRDETIAMFGPAVRELNLLDKPALAGELSALVDRELARDPQARHDSELVGLTLATGYFAILYAWCTPGPAPFGLRERIRDLVTLIVNGM